MANQESHAFGSDSFLDVVTNMVGILIVLVMVVGVQVKHSPATSAPSVPPEELQRLTGEADALERDVLSLEDQIAQINATAQARYAERGTMALLVEERERELAEASKTLEASKQAQFDLRRAKAAAEAELKRAENGLREVAEAEKRKNRTIQIKNRPTPLSRTVFGNELHFQLYAGRAAWIPFQMLEELCAHDIKSRMHRLRDVTEITGTVGPVDGFRARYMIALQGVNDPQVMLGGRPRVTTRMELLPARDDLGEPFDVALGPTSQFRARLAGLDPKQTTVTLWTYPDGFSAYSAIKEELYKLGFNVAARPLPEGTLISGSDQGSHSQAQ